MNSILHNLRLLIVGIGFGVILSGTICVWSVMPISFKIFFCVALTVVFYFAIHWLLLSHEEYANNEQHDPYS
jgi:hypothetical protein